MIPLTICLAASASLLVVRPLFWFFAVGTFSFWWFELRNQRYPKLLSGPTGIAGVVLGCLVFPFSPIASALLTLIFFFSVIQKTGWHANALQRKSVTWLGRISYSLYLLHPFVLDVTRTASLRLAPYIGKGPAAVFFGVVGVTASICVARVPMR